MFCGDGIPVGRAGAIGKTCGSRSLGCLLGAGDRWFAFDEDAAFESCAARTNATRCGALTARQRCCADSISLNAIAIPAAREPGPLVTRWRSRTVTNVDPDRVGGAQVDPVLGREVVERRQHVEVRR